jgi:nickel/cobalt transporter (NicO) family protein
VTATALLLFLSSCSTAVIHALIPDHWLPFVLMARSQRWSERRTAVLTGLAGSLHVLMSILVGVLAIALGSVSVQGLAQRTGRSLDFLAGALLVFFGVAYGFLAHRREARAHGRQGLTAGPAEGHDETSHVHVHGHLLERWFHGALTGGALVLIIGMSPCSLLVPILFAASAEGPAAIVAAALGFMLCTIGTMVGVALFATRGMKRLEWPLFTRYGDLASGALVAMIGLTLMILEA